MQPLVIASADELERQRRSYSPGTRKRRERRQRRQRTQVAAIVLLHF
jgi:hypothetical protein